MIIGRDDVIFRPAVGSDYCLVTAATVDGRKNFAVLAVKEGNPFPTSIDDEDIFLEVMSPTGDQISVSDIFNAITEVRDMVDTYLPVRIRYEQYAEAEVAFSHLFSKVITSHYIDLKIEVTPR